MTGDLERVVVNYQLSPGGLGLPNVYPGPTFGVSLVVPNSTPSVVDLVLDRDLRDAEKIEGVRRLEVEVRNPDLGVVYHAFGVLAARLYENKPVGIVMPQGQASQALVHSPSLIEVPSNPYDPGSYKRLRGNLTEVTRALIAGRVEFTAISLLELPDGVSPLLSPGRGSLPYRLTHRITGRKEQLTGYARVLDEALTQR